MLSTLGQKKSLDRWRQSEGSKPDVVGCSFGGDLGAVAQLLVLPPAGLRPSEFFGALAPHDRVLKGWMGQVAMHKADTAAKHATPTRRTVFLRMGTSNSGRPPLVVQYLDNLWDDKGTNITPKRLKVTYSTTNPYI